LLFSCWWWLKLQGVCLGWWTSRTRLNQRLKLVCSPVVWWIAIPSRGVRWLPLALLSRLMDCSG
jgi:hypothetical protein